MERVNASEAQCIDIQGPSQMEVHSPMPKRKDLRSFKPKKKGSAADDLLKKAQEMGAAGEQADQVQKLKEQVGRYEGKSEDELMQDLLRMTSEQKQKGQFDAERIAKFKNSLWPMLSEQQRQKLVSILGKMDNQ